MSFFCGCLFSFSWAVCLTSLKWDTDICKALARGAERGELVFKGDFCFVRATQSLAMCTLS